MVMTPPHSIESTERFFHTAPRGNATFIGAKSDICQELMKRFGADQWQVSGWARGDKYPPAMPWDLLVIGVGVLDPIGRFFEMEDHEWEANVDSNAFLPLRMLRRLWRWRRPQASVCFFSGAGVSQSARTYSAYSASKIMLMKMAELLDDEEPVTKFFILGPGMVRTKIQAQTVKAGERAANHERIIQFMDKGDSRHGEGTSHDKIYKCLRWCMSQPKSVIGGRNIYVPSDRWGDEILVDALTTHKSLFKLRRLGDGQY